jgi:Heparinase II/III-like protein/Heparinase II/III N-terminus
MNTKTTWAVLALNKTRNNNKELKQLADKYCNHEFNVLGSGWKKVYYGMTADGFEGKNYSSPFSVDDADKQIPDFYREKHQQLLQLQKKFIAEYEPIDWQIDFKSGARFNAGTHQSKLQYGVISGVDAKVSADLGRLYQLIPLAKAYHIFNDEKYKNELLAELIDFMAYNPPEYGAAWRANMNVAIRAANIVAALDILGWDELDADISEIINENLAAHGKYIFANLEYPEEHFHPNHFIANLTGLLMVACSTANKEWFEYSMETLSEQIIYQTNPEGSNFEGATAYHCLVLEMFTDAFVYAARNAGMKTAAEVNTWLKNKLGEKSFDLYEKMFVVYRDIVQPDGLIPLIGDNDSGRFLYLEKPEIDKRDYRFLSLIGAAIFANDSLLTEYDERHVEYAEILLGQALSFGSVNKPESACWQEAGFYVMRDNIGGYAFINCGPVGTNGKGGHAHNDKLALTLQLQGKDIFVDPGIYAYTASEYFRNAYRSVKAHNTLCLAGEEQNRWGIANAWWGVLEETKCECVQWTASEQKDVFSGKHYAYERLKNKTVHQRTIEWDKAQQNIVITDELKSQIEASPEAECGFILHPECITTYYSEKIVKIKRGDLVLTLETTSGKWDYEPAWYSPGYGQKTYTRRLVLKLLPGTKNNKISIKY